MFTRFTIAMIQPRLGRTFNLWKTSLVTVPKLTVRNLHLKKGIFKFSYFAPHTYHHDEINLHIPHQFYCQQVTNNMVVDYEYVKKATSNNKVLIVDVREPDEIKEHGKIPNSINIPLGSVESVLASTNEAEFNKIYNRPKPVENTEIIFYCMVGKRSGKAQQNALNLGYKNAKNYLGSWTDWATKQK